MTDEATDVDLSGMVDRLTDVQHETGYRLGRVFRDWIELAVYAFADNDEDYLEHLDRYEKHTDEETTRSVAETYSEALGELLMTTTDAGRPVVGDVYEQIGNQADDFGQYFTPWNMSKANAELLITPDDAQDATAEDPLTVSDPACGSGRMLIAAAKTLHEHDPAAHIAVRGTDKDRICAQMAVLNLVIADVPGVVRCGDSITVDIQQAWQVRPGVRPVVDELDPEDVTPTPDEVEDASVSVDDIEEDDVADTVDADLGRWS